MKNATRSAPHIWRNVRLKTSPRIFGLGRKIIRIMSHAAKVDVPPPSGLKLNVEERGVCVTEDMATTDSLFKLREGSFDHGPVHATTTKMSARNGTHA